LQKRPQINIVPFKSRRAACTKKPFPIKPAGLPQSRQSCFFHFAHSTLPCLLAAMKVTHILVFDLQLGGVSVRRKVSGDTAKTGLLHAAAVPFWVFG
ncbi:MAG: hypothetical protein IJI27_02310, partial [Oscillospiraceae bacterium]|nr:hypothetical protein [Oscillospiraceae bacterium]